MNNLIKIGQTITIIAGALDVLAQTTVPIDTLDQGIVL